MARTRASRSTAAPSDAFPPIDAEPPPAGPETTGRFVVIFKDEAAADMAGMKSMLNKVAGLKHVASSADYKEAAFDAKDLEGSEAVQFQKMGVAIVAGADAVEALAASASDSDSPIMAIEPEYVAYPSSLPDPSSSLDYLRGYRDAVNHLYDRLSGAGGSPEPGDAEAEALASFQDTPQFTWGLQAVRASTSRFSGQGIRVAVLDTGIDGQHPDFRGRSIVTQSFVSGVTVQDVAGHGTHCAGTACGPQRPASGVRRYGVAYGAQLFVGKVFNNGQPRPSASTSSVIAGIEWAVMNGCRVASLSLGVAIDQKLLQYDVPTRRALAAGTLVVAAAGNNASRPSLPGFVEPPANADAVLAVGALDRRLRIASFSSRSSQVTGLGGIVNISGPGVAVFSSYPVSGGTHAFLDGTSMATPHVAGVAALWAQATGESGAALANRLLQNARPLSVPAVDVGIGLVQAPQ